VQQVVVRFFGQPDLQDDCDTRSSGTVSEALMLAFDIFDSNDSHPELRCSRDSGWPR
jgi:hypothetical protein